MWVSFISAREMVKNRMEGIFAVARMREQKLLKFPAQPLVSQSHNFCKIQRHVVASLVSDALHTEKILQKMRVLACSQYKN